MNRNSNLVQKRRMERIVQEDNVMKSLRMCIEVDKEFYFIIKTMALQRNITIRKYVTRAILNQLKRDKIEQTDHPIHE